MRRRRALLRSQAVLEQERCPESFSLEAQETPGFVHPVCASLQAPAGEHTTQAPEASCPAGQGRFEKDRVMGCER